MPRFWLEDKPAYLMQIQKDAFLFNWRTGGAQPSLRDIKKAFAVNYFLLAS
jgi:hypothetical protein